MTIGTIYATGAVCMKIKGYVTADATAAQGSANIAATTLKIEASRDIGTADSPLVINAQNVDIRGRNIDLYCLTHLNVDYMRGRNVTITARGTVSGGTVYARNLTVAAYGDIGAPDDRFIVYVWGRLRLSSEYGGVWYRNRYKPQEKHEYPVIICDVIPIPGDSGAQPTNLSWLYILLALLLLGVWSGGCIGGANARKRSHRRCVKRLRILRKQYDGAASLDAGPSCCIRMLASIGKRNEGLYITGNTADDVVGCGGCVYNGIKTQL